MKKHNLSEIMKAAWNLRKMFLKWVTSLSFSECLHRAWKSAKETTRVFSDLMCNVQVGGTLVRPALVDIDMDALTVTGNTCSVRSMIHEFGLVWDRNNKAWTSSRETLNSIYIEYV